LEIRSLGHGGDPARRIPATVCLREGDGSVRFPTPGPGAAMSDVDRATVVSVVRLGFS
jgi:hypothetical protein